uniref:Uncharacterized protein n=1 Tax=Strongyloides papillosus TaxID=174720 RepID=A0A0N5BUT6_STREA
MKILSYTEILIETNGHISGNEGENKEAVENANENQGNEGETVIHIRKLPRKPSVYGDFVDITDVKDASERERKNPWLQEAEESHLKKKISPSKNRTGIKGMSRAEWLKSQKENKEEEEIIPVEKLESDEEDEPVDTEKKAEDNQGNDDDGSAIYLDPEIDFVAFCRQEEEELERQKTVVASQFKKIIMILNWTISSRENSCDSFKKLKILETQGEKKDTNEVEEKNEDDEDIIENVPEKKAGSDDDEENGGDLNAYEIMDRDFDEIGNQKNIVNDLAKQRILQELKADRKRLDKIKEKLNIYDEDDPEQAALIYRYQTRFMAENVDVEILERASDTEDYLEVIELSSEDSITI